MKNIILITAFTAGSIAPAAAQLSAGSDGFFIKSGTPVSIDGLTLQPSADLNITNNTITVSHTPVPATTPGSNGSIARVYEFTAPLVYEGDAGIRYLTSELNGNAVASLQPVYKNNGLNSFVNTDLNATSSILQYVEGATTAPITITRITAVNSGVILPIELLEFTVLKEGNHSRLDWSTALEHNNDHFDIERSADGKEFVYLLTERSKGNSDTQQDYTAYDEKPFTGWNYYRLKQVDLDGKSGYSPVRKVFFDGVGNEISVYPNPTQGRLTLSILSQQEGEQFLQITDISGRLIQCQSISIHKGANYFSIDLTPLAAGSYLLKMDTGFSAKIVKQ